MEKKYNTANLALVSCSAAFVLLAISLIFFFGLNLPIQTDEVAWDQINYRRVIDHYTMISFFPQCGWQSFGSPLPWLWVVPSWIIHGVYFWINHPLDFRIIGLFRLFFCLTLWLLIFKRIFQFKPLELVVISAIILIFFALDHVFLILLVARPEQFLILGISIAIALAVYSPSLAMHPGLAIVSAIVLILLALLLVEANPRGFVFLPLLAITGFMLVKSVSRSSFYAYAFSALITAICIYSYMLWIEGVKCPVLQSNFDREMFPFHLLWENPLRFLYTIIEHFFTSVFVDLSAQDLDGWLYYKQKDLYAKNVVNAFYLVSFFLRIAVLGTTSFYACKQFYDLHIKQCTVSTVLMKANILALCLLAALFSLLIFQGYDHEFYYRTLDVPLLFLSSFLTFGFNHERWRKSPVARGMFFTLLGCAAINLFGMFLLYSNPKQTQSYFPHWGTINFTADDYNNALPDIYKLAKECKITTDGNHIVTDDVTYMPFRDSFQPLNINYASMRIPLSGANTESNVLQFFKLLDDMKSGGIIADCRNVLDPMFPYITQRNGFCCMSSQTIHEIVNAHAH